MTDAKPASNLSRRLRGLTHPALLVVDEIGYLPVSQGGTVLFFQLVQRPSRAGVDRPTSNKGFEEWAGVLGDEIMAAALIGRVLHHRHIVNIRATATGRGRTKTCFGLAPTSGAGKTCDDSEPPPLEARPMWPTAPLLLPLGPHVEWDIFSYHKCDSFGCH